MGHIINAKSMRIGWSIIWADQWYTEVYYYSEFLHAMFRIRFYLIYIFTRKHFDKKAIFYSHFEIIKYYKNLFIEIFYYSGKLENDYENFKFDFFYKIFNFEFNKDPETRKPKFLFIPIKLFVIWSWALNFKLENIKFKFLGILSQIIRKYNLNYLKNIINNFKIKKLKIKLNIFFYFFLLLSIYIKAKQFIKLNTIYKPKKNTLFRRMYMLISCYKIMYIYIYIFSIILSYIFTKLINKNYFINFIINFFLINNNCINAKFLSRYISRKLKQNYPIKELLNPIKKDLLYVIKLSIIPKKSYNNFLNKKIGLFYNNYIKNKFIYKNIFNLINLIYNLYLYKFFKFTKIWLTFELFYFFNLLNSKIKNKFELIKISIIYFKRKLAYICFFENKLYILNKFEFKEKNLNLVLLPKSQQIKIFNFKNINYYNLIFNYLYIGNNNLFNKIYNDKFLYNNNIIRFSCINFNKYLKFNYWIYQIYINSKNNNWKNNNLKSRIKQFTKANNLMGYKMYLSGRFKRKQRAAYYWFSKGKVPLNSLSAYIDYSFYTIPLKNSAITVKIWLYKSSNINNIYYIKLY